MHSKLLLKCIANNITRKSIINNITIKIHCQSYYYKNALPITIKMHYKLYYYKNALQSTLL